MSIKTIMGWIVSAILIMFGGFVLFNLAFVILGVLANGFEIFADATGEVSREMLLLALFVGSVIIVAIIAKFILSKEQLKHTLFAMLLTLPLMVIIVMIGIALYGQSDFVILLAGGAVIIPVLLLMIKKKVNWTYMFATVYVACLGLLIMIFNIEI
jgi:hypothetical protein